MCALTGGGRVVMNEIDREREKEREKRRDEK